MAGSGTNLIYPRNTDSHSHQLGNGNYNIDLYPNEYLSMEDDVIVQQLHDPSVDRRLQALDDLRSAARRNKGIFPSHGQRAVFEGLSNALTDNKQDVRLSCIKLIYEVIPTYADKGNLDEYMVIVLPKLVPNVGDSVVIIRRTATQTIHVYMKYTRNVPLVLGAVVRYGLEHQEPRVKKQVIVSLPMLLTPEFTRENFFDVAQALAKRLLDSSLADEDIKRFILASMEKIRGLVGDQEFNSYIQKLSSPLRKYYLKLTNNEEFQNEKNGSQSSDPYSRRSKQTESNGRITIHDHGAFEYQSSPTHNLYQQGITNLEFGVVPSHIMDKLNDQTNFRTRAQAVEELRVIIKDLDEYGAQSLNPNANNFITFLNNLLDDSNFKITTVTLEILGLLVEKLNMGIRPYLKPHMSCLTKRMGDNKIVIRQAIMKVIMQLMQILGPKPVLSVITENLSNRNNRVRQETLNIIIASLLTFPSYDFDLGQLCADIAHTLVDPKRQVRQASLECFAVIAQAMGAGKLQSLVGAVDSVELSYEGDGVMAAVQARLTRRQLPKLNADGLVDYATPLPSSGTVRGATLPSGPDVEWILQGSVSAGSARSTRSDHMDLESVVSSARSTPSNFAQDSPSRGPTPRRLPSAGKHKSKLPWEDDQHDGSASNRQGYSIEDGRPQVKPRTTWGGEAFGNEMKKSKKKGQTGSADNSRDQSPEPGSYRQIHMNKYRRQMSDGAASNPPFSVYGGSKDNDTAYSTLHSSLSSTPVPTPSEIIPAVTAVGSSAYARDFYGNVDRVSSATARPAYLRNELDDMVDHNMTSFSQSWSDPSMFEDALRPSRAFLGPIKDSAHVPFVPDWNEKTDERKAKADKTPIPTKPSLARSVSSKKKIPPISVDSNKEFYREEDTVDSARDSIFDDDEDPEMTQALHKIRNSASKKKVKKMFERLESRENASRSPSPPSTAGESGVYSNAGKDNSGRRKSKKSDAPFENKPRIVRKTNNQSPTPTSLTSDSQTSLSGQHGEYKPHGGVTFLKNPSSDVEIVGKGIADDSQATDPKPSHHAQKAKDRRKPMYTKSVLSPLGMASTNSHGQMEVDDDRTPVGVVGKGMFDTSPTNDYSQGGANNDRRDRRASRSGPEANLPPGVYGVRVRTNSQGQSSGDSEDDDDDDASTISISKSTRERLAQKQRQKQEEAEERERAEREQERAERLRKQREQEERRRQEEDRVRREKERQQEKLRRLSSQEEEDMRAQGLAISGSNQQVSAPLNNNTVNSPNGIVNKKPPAKSTPTPKRKTRPPPTEALAHPSSAKAGEIEPSENLKRFNDPYAAFNEAMKLIANQEWEAKCTGLNHIRRLVIHHPEVLTPSLHSVNVALIQEVKNLRSQVSRLAIVCLGDMYASLKRHMDADLDQTVKALLGKSGESNNFIRADIEQTMYAMVENVLPQRALLALIAGVGHKNTAVRKHASSHLVALVERMGPGRILSGIKDLTDKLLPAAAQIVLDGNQETRYNGQRILYMLMDHDEFEKMMKKYVSDQSLRNIQDKLDNLRRKGLGDPPSESASARARRSGQGPRSNTNMTRGNSATSDLSQDSTSSKRPIRTNDATMEDIMAMNTLMSASDWRDRQKGIQQLLDMTRYQPDVIGNHINKIFDKLVPCLKDSNSKVNLFALQSLKVLTPALKDYFGTVVNITIQIAAANLSSKNPDIHKAASDALDAFMENLDPSLLLHPFANQAQSGNARIKPDMIDRVAYLSTEVYATSKKQKVVLHVLPLLWHLLGMTQSSGSIQGGTGNLRLSISSLVHSLFSCLGNSLMDYANNNSNVTPRMQQALRELINNP